MGEKIYLINVNKSNNGIYEDYIDYDEIIMAFKNKKDAIKYISDIDTLYKEFCLDAVRSNGDCIKDVMDDVKRSYVINVNEGYSEIHLKDFFLAYKDNKYDRDGDRNDPDNWHCFFSDDVTNFIFSVREMELR